jgi:hypothetical protein
MIDNDRLSEFYKRASDMYAAIARENVKRRERWLKKQGTYQERWDEIKHLFKEGEK